MSNNDPRAVAAKRWGLANGYRGAQGGWVYKVTLRVARLSCPENLVDAVGEFQLVEDWKPVAQGWLQFYYTFKDAIWGADAAAELAFETKAS